jgi:hypothetical protein
VITADNTADATDGSNARFQWLEAEALLLDKVQQHCETKVALAHNIQETRITSFDHKRNVVRCVLIE